ncbi:MAG TPA: ATP-binding protein [Thermodesulfovibrionales bacterium]|jgi:two-component system heavy metal sensor histidine kinase CusS|nr:ATP-binding protein [Thermodesulfovibrionales bacterium]
MIELTQRRLTLRFALTLLAFTVLLLTLVSLYFHQTIINSAKRHLGEMIRSQFIDQFNRTGLDTFNGRWDEYHFQILNTEGEIVVSSPKTVSFYPDLNMKLLKETFSGNQSFKKQYIHDEPYLVAYFPLNEKFSGRVSASISTELEYERSFLKLLFATLPGILLLSYFFSRYMVHQATKPISDVFTYQENFSSSVTHELRSPLASLKGNLEVSLRKDRDPGEYREIIRLGLTEVDRITNLLNDLSFLSSSKFKPLDLFKEEMDIKTIVAELIECYSARIREKGITIENNIQSSIRYVCDGTLMKRVFDNILNNAVKYTPEGGLITIHALKDSGKVLVHFSNTCKGIAREELEYFFEPFYRGKTSAKEHFDGKGLGLYIARYIVRSHGGEITPRLKDDEIFSLIISLPPN